jgi:DNA primase large subunit
MERQQINIRLEKLATNMYFGGNGVSVSELAELKRQLKSVVESVTGEYLTIHVTDAIKLKSLLRSMNTELSNDHPSTVALRRSANNMRSVMEEYFKDSILDSAIATGGISQQQPLPQYDDCDLATNADTPE